MLVTAFFAGISVVSATQNRRVADDGTVIENVTLISPERAAPLLHAGVHIRRGRIAEVAAGLVGGPHAHRISGAGKFLVPGLIDSHVHVGHSAALDEDAIAAHRDLWAAYRAQVPLSYLAFGFTSIVDLDLTQSDRAWFDGTPLHPRLYSCGMGIKVAGGYGAFEVASPASPTLPNLIYEPEEAAHWPKTLDPAAYTADRAVARDREAGAICVKAFVEPGFGMFHWPYLHTATLRKIRTAASAHNLTLIVHANSDATWQSAMSAHADIIAHGLWIWPGDVTSSHAPETVRDAIAAAAIQGVRVQPTLQTVAGERAFFDTSLLDDPRLAFALPPSVIAHLRSAEGQKARKLLLHEYQKMSPAPGFERLLGVFIERTRASFKMMLQNKVPVLLGSDTPAGDGFGNPPGLNGRLEMQDWADNGAPLQVILRSATLGNAIALGLSRELGSIEPGKRADLLLLRQNPLASVTAYDFIETVFVDGEPVERKALRR